MDDEKWEVHGELCWRRSRSSRNYERFGAGVTRPRGQIWRILWRRIKKEKKRMFSSSSCSNSLGSSSMRFTYDSYSYAQNFDEGLMMCADPDDISRSFSARFAVSSRFLEKNTTLML